MKFFYFRKSFSKRIQTSIRYVLACSFAPTSTHIWNQKFSKHKSIILTRTRERPKFQFPVYLKMLSQRIDFPWRQIEAFKPFPVQDFSPWQVKSSGVSQSKISNSSMNRKGLKQLKLKQLRLNLTERHFSTTKYGVRHSHPMISMISIKWCPFQWRQTALASLKFNLRSIVSKSNWLRFCQLSVHRNYMDYWLVARIIFAVFRKQWSNNR